MLLFQLILLGPHIESFHFNLDIFHFYNNFFQCSDTLLSDDSLVVTLALGPSPPSVSVQRAALNFVTTLCSELDVPRPALLSLLERLLHCLINPNSEDIDPVLKAKVYVCHKINACT